MGILNIYASYQPGDAARLEATFILIFGELQSDVACDGTALDDQHPINESQ